MNYEKTSTHPCVAPGAGLEPASQNSILARTPHHNPTQTKTLRKGRNSSPFFQKNLIFFCILFRFPLWNISPPNILRRKPADYHRLTYFPNLCLLKTIFSKLMHSSRRQPDRPSIRQTSQKTSPMHPRPTTSPSMPRICPRNAPNFNYLPPASINPRPITKCPEKSLKYPENQTPLKYIPQDHASAYPK